MKALKDMYYLVNRGYSQDSAVRIVGDHYQLEKEERYKLKRIVFPEREISRTEKKKREITYIKDKKMAVDGYNVLITTESVLKNDVFLCFDGVVRDVQGIFKKYKFDEEGERALEEIFSVLTKYPPKDTQFFFDVQISKSGELCSRVRRMLRTRGLEGDAQTTKSVDYALKNRKMLTATNDSVIIQELDEFVDIPHAIWRRKYLPKHYK